MANPKPMKGGRRYCEECGRPIESRDPDAFLCRRCELIYEEEQEVQRRAERAIRKRQRAERLDWDDDEFYAEETLRARSRRNRR
ncbi:MAG: hypothetical protein Kow0047_14950 [Anaerolineae bacterium]